MGREVVGGFWGGDEVDVHGLMGGGDLRFDTTKHLAPQYGYDGHRGHSFYEDDIITVRPRTLVRRNTFGSTIT